MTDREKIEALVEEELTRANEKYPLFRSPHEAYAVMLEEVEEMIHDIDIAARTISGMWSHVKEDESIEADAGVIKTYTISAIQEAIQVAAMAKKVLQSELYK